MKEFERIFDSFGGGLRKFGSVRNGDGLSICHQWMPMEEGLRPHETLTDITTATEYYLLTQNEDNLLLQTGSKIII